MLDYTHIAEQLQQAIEDPDKIESAFKMLHKFVFIEKNTYATLPELVQEVLLYLAYELDFFEPNLHHRNEDPSLFGITKAQEKIRLALQTINEEEPTLNNKKSWTTDCSAIGQKFLGVSCFLIDEKNGTIQSCQKHLKEPESQARSLL